MPPLAFRRLTKPRTLRNGIEAGFGENFRFHPALTGWGQVLRHESRIAGKGR